MIDFTPWDQMLRRYVNPQGRVNYRSWQSEAHTDLQAWLTQLSPTRLEDYSDTKQLAYWLNLYNAYVIEQVLGVYPIRSIRPTVLGIPNWLAFLRFFQRAVHPHGSHAAPSSLYPNVSLPYSLNDIEHRIVRPHYREPRIHFALVCAAVGCPLLRAEAYWPERMAQQLDEDARRFINNPAKVQYEAETRTLHCSKIFRWYQQDFLTVTSASGAAASESIAYYIQSYRPQSLPPDVQIRYLDYDWALNDATGTQSEP